MYLNVQIILIVRTHALSIETFVLQIMIPAYFMPCFKMSLTYFNHNFSPFGSVSLRKTHCADDTTNIFIKILPSPEMTVLGRRGGEPLGSRIHINATSVTYFQTFNREKHANVYFHDIGGFSNDK